MHSDSIKYKDKPQTTRQLTEEGLILFLIYFLFGRPKMFVFANMEDFGVAFRE